MDKLDRPLPFFVYGTLRPGHHNYDRLLRGRTASERPAVVKGHRLYVRGVPYAVPVGRDDRSDRTAVATEPVVGALIQVTPGCFREVVADLDALEGFDRQDPQGSLYRRVLTPRVTAQTPIRQSTATISTFHRAWIYIAGDGFDPRTATLVPSGDFEGADAKLAEQRRSRRT